MNKDGLKEPIKKEKELCTSLWILQILHIVTHNYECIASWIWGKKDVIITSSI